MPVIIRETNYGESAITAPRRRTPAQTDRTSDEITLDAVERSAI